MTPPTPEQVQALIAHAKSMEQTRDLAEWECEILRHSADMLTAYADLLVKHEELQNALCCKLR